MQREFFFIQQGMQSTMNANQNTKMTHETKRKHAKFKLLIQKKKDFVALVH